MPKTSGCYMRLWSNCLC